MVSRHERPFDLVSEGCSDVFPPCYSPLFLIDESKRRMRLVCCLGWDDSSKSEFEIDVRMNEVESMGPVVENT